MLGKQFWTSQRRRSDLQLLRDRPISPAFPTVAARTVTHIKHLTPSELLQRWDGRGCNRLVSGELGGWSYSWLRGERSTRTPHHESQHHNHTPHESSSRRQQAIFKCSWAIFPGSTVGSTPARESAL